MASALRGCNVTTGTRETGYNPQSVAPPSNSPFFWRKKTWTGTDGKYNANGVLQDHPYTMNSFNLEGVTNSIGAFLVPGGTIQNVSLVQWTPNDDLRLNGNLLEAVNGHELHLGIAIGEGRKTMQMVYQNLTTIGGALRDCKRGDLRAARKLLGMTSVKQSHAANQRFQLLSLANRWLELQYGWKPLIRDVYSGMVAFALINDPPRHWELKVKHNKPYAKGTEYDSANKVRRKCKAKAMSTMHYTFTERLDTPRSLGLHDPEAIAWEVMPWSFVIDWFIPIGSYLQQLNTVPRLEGKFVKSVFQVYDASVLAETKATVYAGCRAHYESVRLERTVTTGLTTALPVFVPLDKIMSENRFYNAVALATQLALR